MLIDGREWKLVPVEPTPEMLVAGAKVVDWYAHNALECYHAMLDAAPTPPGQGQGDDCDDVDAILRIVGLDPERCRTEGGMLNVGRVRTLWEDVVSPAAQASGQSAAPGIVYRWHALDYSGYCYGSNPPDDLPARCNLTAFYSQPDAFREALHEISATGNLTATPAQFARHLQRIARDALVGAQPAAATEPADEREALSRNLDRAWNEGFDFAMKACGWQEGEDPVTEGLYVARDSKGNVEVGMWYAKTTNSHPAEWDREFRDVDRDDIVAWMAIPDWRAARDASKLSDAMLRARENTNDH